MVHPEDDQTVRPPGGGEAAAGPTRQDSPQGAWSPGARVGSLVVVRQIGQGAMGSVYEARDAATGVGYAIKTMHAFATPEMALRFEREGSAQAAVDMHPNVVRVHSAGQAMGRRYLVLELLPGGDLKQRLREGPLPVDDALALVAALARGLAHVHAGGLLHRDIKPANVLFDERDTPKLADFGLVRQVDACSLTKTGAILGTPAYMSPEQADGRKDYVDARSDVYGLGALLFHVLTGRPPFVASSPIRIIAQVLSKAPEAPSTLVEGIPGEVDRVCLRALAKPREDRYPDAASFAEALDAVLAEPPAEPAPRWPIAVAGVLALGVLIAVLLALPPSLEIQRPTSGSVSKVGSVEVEGVLGGLAPVRAVTVNGQAAEVDGDSFKARITLPTEGEHELRVVAHGVMRESVSIVQVRADGTPPELSVSAPPSHSIVSGGRVTLRGRVQDATACLVRAGEQGEPVTVAPGAEFQVTLPVADGITDRDLEVTVEDAAGNPGQAVRLRLRLLHPPAKHDTATLLDRYRVPGRPGEYLVTRTLEIQLGQRLVLPAGTTLRFSPSAGLSCKGQLWCLGESGKPVSLTAATETGSWQGVKLRGEGVLGILRHTELRQAKPQGILDDADAFLAGVSLYGGARFVGIDSALVECQGLGSGGGLHASGQGTRVECYRMRFADCCTAKDGGGAHLGPDASGEFEDCLFTNNRAHDGGGLSLAGPGSQTRLQGVRFERNTARSDAGGLLLARLAELIDCRFQDNRAERGNGGALHAREIEGGLTFKRVRFVDNRAANLGGAALLLDASACFDDCSFVRNRVPPSVPGESRWGGGVAAKTGAYAFEGVSFLENSASDGAGLWVGDADIELLRCSFVRNHGSDPSRHDSMAAGVGLLAGGPGPRQVALFDRCTFEGNRASRATAIQFTGRWDLKLRHTKFLSNVAESYGAGLAAGAECSVATVDLVGCTFEGNQAPKNRDIRLGDARWNEAQLRAHGLTGG